jgi:uncharacterized protein (DUF1778 family)
MKGKGKVVAYLLRDIPKDVRDAAKAAAALEGKSIRDVLLAALRRYAKKVKHG